MKTSTTANLVTSVRVSIQQLTTFFEKYVNKADGKLPEDALNILKVVKYSLEESLNVVKRDMQEKIDAAQEVLQGRNSKEFDELINYIDYLFEIREKKSKIV